MKPKRLIILTAVFFLVINTSYFWQILVGGYLFPVTILLGMFFIVLLVALPITIGKAYEEKYKNKPRLFSIIFLSLTLVLTVFFPSGVINFERFEGNSLLIAHYEGAANCTTTLKLKANNKFKIQSICFGVDEVKGEYEIKQDTIFFKNKKGDKDLKRFNWGIMQISDTIKHFEYQNILGLVTLYENSDDKNGYEMYIFKNELIK